MPIAITGIGCRFPGGIVDTESFWRVVAGGIDAITEIPADRFDIAKYYDPTPGTRGKIMTRWGGFIDQRLEEFDADFFGISRTYAERLDPQQRLLLETAWEAMEDAGLDIIGLQGSPTGVFVGQWVSDFEHRLFGDPGGIDFAMAMGSGRYAAAGRLSYAFGFRGASLSIDAACSSGLASVHLAVRSLRSGDSAIALAGGVNMILQPHIHLAYSFSKMMAPDGRCRFGDARGSGYVRAEGAGMVVLKPLASAIADGDRIYAVIRGSAVNSDGDSSGSMGRPSRIGQEELLRSALRDGGVKSTQLDYVEAHGTGTRAGDPVELDALAAVASEGRAPDAPRLWVGSVKTNFGHTEAAAGVAGLIKTALMLQHGLIPPSLHFEEPNPEVRWAELPLAIPTALTAWPTRVGTRLAGVSSYGIGGTNAHVVLEMAPALRDTELRDGAPETLLLPLSARSDAAVRALADRYADLLTAPAAPAVADVCFSAAARRSALSHRAAFVAADRDALVAALRGFAAGAPATADGTVHDRARRRVAFVVPGQGAQWTGMAREFFVQEPVFRHALASCDAAARAHVPWSIVEQLHLNEGDPGYLGDRIDVIQPTLIALAVAYAAWLRSLGIEPDAVVGHSLGEVGAAAIAGVLSLQDAMRIICRRSALMQRTSGQGAMAVVELSAADVQARLKGHESAVSVAVSNSPRSTVISGEPASLQAILAELERDGVFCRLVKVDVASHSPQMEPLVPELVQSLSDLSPRSPMVWLYSTVTGTSAQDVVFDATYWGRNLTQPVQFGPTVSQMIADGITTFVELGPHPVLTQAVQQVAQAASTDVAVVACGRRNEPDVATAMGVVATLWCAGVQIDWRRVMPWGTGTVALPLYPWQRQRYWADAAELPDSTVSGSVSRRSIDPALRATLYTCDWQRIDTSAGAGLRRAWRWIVVAGGNTAAAASIASALQQRGAQTSVVSTMHEAGVVLRDGFTGSERVGVVVLPAGDAELAYSPVCGLNDLQRTLSAAASSLTPRVFWLTFGAHVVPGFQTGPTSAQGAALWGAARVLAEEHPTWWGGLVDLEPVADGTAQAGTLAEFLTSDTGEDHVALRDCVLHALRLVPLPVQSSTQFKWRTDAAYLITGGFGGLARQLATAMAADGARRLILLSRTPLPPRNEWSHCDLATPLGVRVATVRALEHAGASVHVMCADVSDEAAMRCAIEAYRAEGWPDIDGVVHAAGLIDNQLSGEMTAEQFARVMSGKVQGAEVLDRLFPDVSLFVLCSSIMAFWGSAGMANYAASNAGADALAAMRRARGRHAISVQWCVWQDTGMVDDAHMRRNVREMAQLGLRPISGAEGLACFALALTRPETVMAVLPVDWATFAQARRGRVQPLFRAIPEATAATDAPDGWAQTIAASSAAARRPLLETLVRTVVSDVLRRPAALIGARESFGTLGVDSLLALEIRNRLESALERPLSATVTWNYNTVTALAAHLHDCLSPVPAPPTAATDEAPVTGGAPSSDVGSLIDSIGTLSDDDALRALRRTR